MKRKVMNKTVLGFFVALFAIVLALNAVAGSYGDGDFVSISEVEVDGIELGGSPSFDVSENIPVEVYFTADRDASDVKVEVALEGLGLKDDIEDVTERFHVVGGKDYVKRLTLILPSTMDLDDLTEDATFVVKITAEDEDTFVKEYCLSLQRHQYNLNILSIDTPGSVTAGSSFPVEVVVENNGNERLENVYVVASIPDLGVQKRVYVGDIDPLDEIESNGNGEYDEDETSYKKIYLTLPSDAASGVYNLVVEAYNTDVSVIKQEKITVSAVETSAYALGSKTVAPGQETTLQFTLVNPSESVMVYTITPEASTGLIVEVLEPTVVVSGQDSKTVNVRVKATESAEEGTHVVTLNINSESGLVKQVPLTVNVEKSSTGVGFAGRSDAVFILTVILVIVFVVLLIILIVLLTKKPAETEEFGETSYY